MINAPFEEVANGEKQNGRYGLSIINLTGRLQL